MLLWVLVPTSRNIKELKSRLGLKFIYELSSNRIIRLKRDTLKRLMPN